MGFHLLRQTVWSNNACNQPMVIFYTHSLEPDQFQNVALGMLQLPFSCYENLLPNSTASHKRFGLRIKGEIGAVKHDYALQYYFY